MAENEEVVKTKIKEYIDRSPYPYANWYVGVASDPESRLFNDHKVGKYWWIYKECLSSDAARRVEDYFLNNLGTDGGPGGGDENSTFVYAYHKTSETNEEG